MNLNLEYYKIFYHIGKAGSITAAAKNLSISQPAVSQSIRHLEETLGTKLFQRSSKGIKLTAEGEILFEHVAKGYETILQGEAKLTHMLNLDTGEIRIGASDMTLQFYLLPYLERFHEAHPGIKVSVTNAPTPETLQNMDNSQIDFGVISTPFEHLPSLDIRPVKDIQDIFIAGPKFFRLKNRRLSFEQLENMPLICLEKNSSTRKYMDQLMAQKKIHLRPEFELATSDMIVQFAIRNLGIGYVMSEFAQSYIKSGQIFALTFRSPLPKRQFCVITKKGSPLSTAARELLHML